MKLAVNPLEHPDFTFTMISGKAQAHQFDTCDDAQEFARGIQKHAVLPNDDKWVVRVGPWMHASNIQKRRKAHVKHKFVLNKPMTWTPELLCMLGNGNKDTEIAAIMGCTSQTVGVKRRELGISSEFSNSARELKWTPEKDSLLGTMSDFDIAKRVGCSPFSVWRRRRQLGVISFGPSTARKSA